MALKRFQPARMVGLDVSATMIAGARGRLQRDGLDGRRMEFVPYDGHGRDDARMDGLLLVSYFNHLRAEGLSLQQSIMQGAEKRVRPIMMTALTAIFGLSPGGAAVGSQGC